MDHYAERDRVGRVEFSDDPRDRYLQYRQTLALETIAYLIEALMWALCLGAIGYAAGMAIEEFFRRKAA
jgi:hypothetical protein